MLFRLRTPHIIGGAVRNPGTVVGPYASDAPVKYEGEPTPDMEGADEEGVSKINEVYQRIHGTNAPWHEEGWAKPERPFAGDHPDYAEISDEEQEKNAELLREANARYHGRGGTGPMTVPPPTVSVGVRPSQVDEAPPTQIPPQDTPPIRTRSVPRPKPPTDDEDC
jgi:hypothetical protein